MSSALPAHHRPNGGFRNPWGNGQLHGFGAFIKWRLFDRATVPLRPDPDPSVFSRAAPAFARPRAAAERVTVTWVGHATFLLQAGGLNILTDPMWSERAGPVQFAGPRRVVPPGIAFEDLPPIDIVLQSHNHYDHLDAGTVRRLAAEHPDAQWLAPLGLERWLARHGTRARELDWWSAARIGGLALTATPAQHFSARSPFDRDRTLWCGWSIATPSRRIFFAGDTGYHPEFPEIGRRLGPFDLALVPIGAYDPRWFMRPVHMDPEEAVRAVTDLAGDGAAPAMVPMHWGTFKLTDEPLDEPPRRASAAWTAASLPAARFWLLAHGETRSIEGAR